jgi:hypothetical protein
MTKKLLSNLLNNLKSIDEVYSSAVYGASHKEARVVRLLAKLGSKFAQKKLSHEEFTKIVKEIEAIDNIKKQELIKINFNSKELSFLRNVVRSGLITIKRIPALAREQAVISLMLVFEGFVSDLLRNIFENNMDTLKSTKSTLKDEELIDALKTGNTLERLKEAKVRDLMYGSVEDWIKYFQNNLGFKIDIQNDVIELNLVRNCLIHNNGLVSHELEKIIKKKRYIYAKQINVSEKDFYRYKNAIQTFARKMSEEHIEKFEKTNA